MITAFRFKISLRVELIARLVDDRDNGRLHIHVQVRLDVILSVLHDVDCDKYVHFA